MIRKSRQLNLLRFGSYALAGIALLALILAAWLNSTYPDTGLIYSRYTGKVIWVDPEGPAAGKIFAGAHLYYLNGKAVETFYFPLAWSNGDRVRIVFANGRGLEATRIELTGPSLRVILERFTPLLAALIFWFVGVIVFLRSRLGWLSTIFMFACQTVTLTIGLGSFSNYEIAFILPVFQGVSWWVGPFFLQIFFILLFPDRRGWGSRFLLIYLLTLVLSVSASLGLFLNLPLHGSRLINAWTSVYFLAIMVLADLSYFKMKTVELRRMAGMLILASSGGLIPITLLSLLPEAFTGDTLIRYPITTLALPLIALGVGYAISRNQLVRWESTIQRSAANALAALVVACLYLTVFLGLPWLLPGKERQISALGLLAVIGLVFAARPLYILIQRGLTKMVYGGWYEERAVIRQISLALSQSEGDASGVAETLCQALVRTLQLAYARLLLSDGSLLIQEVDHSQPNRRVLPAQLAQSLLGFYMHDEKSSSLSSYGKEGELPLSKKDRQHIFGLYPQMELLLAGHTEPLGLLVLGPRRGVEFAPRDLEILEVIVRQAKSALENARLLGEIRQRSEHVNRLHRQLLEAREEERKRVARDLHDQTVQALVGLNYQIARIKKHQNSALGQELETLQREVQQILRDVRQVCSDLRPPGLDEMGLEPAIRSRLAVFRSQNSCEIEFLAQDGLQLSEESALCLYRFFQEALTNIHKHANAGCISVHLAENNGCISLTVEDDGQGFELPECVDALAQEQHFGLVGLKEQVNAIGGEMMIDTAPGKGCRIIAKLPTSSRLRRSRYDSNTDRR